MINMSLWSPLIVITGFVVLVSHEYGHVLVARMNGATPSHPIFIPLGVLTLGLTLVRGLARNPGRRHVLLAGPVTGMCTALMLLITAVRLPLLTLAAALLLLSELYAMTFGSDARKAREGS